MTNYWQSSFIPINLFGKDFWGFILNLIKDLYRFLGFGSEWWIAAIFSLSIVIVLIKNKKYRMIYFLFGVVIFFPLLSYSF